MHTVIAGDVGIGPERTTARGPWAAAVAVVRSWLTRPERHRAWDARIEERRDTVRRELLLRDPRLW